MGDTTTINIANSPFFREVLGVIDTYEEQFWTKPSVVKMRAPFYDGVQAEFEAITGKKSGLATIQGVPIEKVPLIYKYDLEAA